MKTVIEPIAFRIVIKPDPVKEVTKGGIVIASDKKLEKAATVSGVVLAIGPDVYNAFKTALPNAGLKVGDHVLYARYAGKGVQDPVTKEDLLLMNDEDVVAKIPSEATKVLDVDTIVAS